MTTYIEKYIQIEQDRIEREIMTAVIADLLTAGYKLGGEIDGEKFKFKTAKGLFAKIDEYYVTKVYIYAAKPYKEKCQGWVKFVLGNVDCVISDYSTTLEAYMARANKIADKYS